MALSTTTNRVSYAGDDVSTGFSFPYYFLANADLVVLITSALGVVTTKTITTHYTVTGAGVAAGGTVTMLTAPATGETLTIYRSPAVTQTLDLVENDALPAESVEEALDRNTMISQRNRELAERSIRLDDGFAGTFSLTLPTDINTSNTVLVVNSTGTGFDVGPTTTDLINAEANAAAAAASAGSASTSASAASTSAAAAAVSATAAQTAVDSVIWSDVVFYTDADSPITVADADRGKLLAIDCTNGVVTVNLPSIAALDLTDPWAVGIKKTDSSTNAITVARNGTDTINGGTSATIDTAGGGLVAIPDTDPAPDEWTTQSFGAVEDGSITNAKMNSQYVADLTAVVPVAADFVPLADASDSNNKKKASVSYLRNAVYRSVVATDSVGADDETMKLSGASFTSTLPTAVGIEGKRYKYIHQGTSLTQVYTLATTSSQTIGGVAGGSYALYTNGEVLEIESDGANWLIINHFAETAWVDAGTITIDAVTTAPTKGTTATDRVLYMRKGSEAFIRYEYEQTGAGSAGSGNYLFTLPSTLQFDTNIVSVYTGTLAAAGANPEANAAMRGFGNVRETGAGDGDVQIVPYDASRFRVWAHDHYSSSDVMDENYYDLAVATIGFRIDFVVPISGWRP